MCLSANIVSTPLMRTSVFCFKVLFGTDSHTCNAGAFGQFATGIGNTDASFVMGTGKLLIKSPASMQFALEGEMPDHLLAKVRKTPVFV